MQGHYEMKNLQQRTAPGVHAESARINSAAKVHPDAHVGAGTTIAAGAEVAEGAVLGKNVQVEAGARIGPRAMVGSNVVIGMGAEIGNFAIVEANADIGPGTKLAATVPDKSGEPPMRTIVRENAKIGTGCTLAPGSAVDQNCVIGNGVAIGERSTIESGSKIGSRTNISAKMAGRARSRDRERLRDRNPLPNRLRHPHRRQLQRNGERHGAMRRGPASRHDTHDGPQASDRNRPDTEIRRPGACAQYDAEHGDGRRHIQGRRTTGRDTGCRTSGGRRNAGDGGDRPRTRTLKACAEKNKKQASDTTRPTQAGINRLPRPTAGISDPAPRTCGDRPRSFASSGTRFPVGGD